MVKIYEGGINSNSEQLFVEDIRKVSEEGGKILVIVPDQFSFEYDKQLYNSLGAVAFNNIQTAGFNRLCQLMTAQYGADGKENASENAKIIMMYKAIKQAKKDTKIHFYNKSLEKSAFISQLLKLVEQFRESGITPEALQLTAEKTEGSVSKKLYDISAIYSFYLDELKNAELQDSVSLIAQCVKLAGKNNFFKDMNVFVSSFTDFSFDQKKMISVCINQAKNFSISLTVDNDCLKKFNNHPFTQTIQTQQFIEDCAKNNNCEFRIINSEKDNYNSDEIRYVSKNLFNTGKKPYEKKCENVHIISASDLYEETEYICAEISRLVREENYQYKDIAVTVRDLSLCSSVFEDIFERYEIPYFIDMQDKVTASSIVHYLNALFNCVLTKKYKTSNIMKYIKSPLCLMLNYEISELEEYCTKWNVDGDMWLSDFTAESYNKEYIDKINSYRKKVIEPLEKFKTSTKNRTAKEICNALYELLREIDLSESTYSVVKRASLSENETQLELARNLKQLWNSVLSAVKSIFDCLGDDKISMRQFVELFRLMLSQMSTSNPPQKLDCVRICDAGHSRLGSVKINFVAEVVDGIFPAKITGSGLITEREKDLINSLEDIKIYDTAKRSFQSEKMVSYCAMSMPTDKLYVSWAEYDLTGNEKRPSNLVKEIKAMFGDDIFIKAGNLSTDFFCTSYKTAYSKYLEHSKEKTPDMKALKNVLEKNGIYREKIRHIEKISGRKEYSLSHSTAEKLFLNQQINRISPTKLDTYFKCPFNYYCNYGLRLRSVQPVKMDGANQGTLIHRILEKITDVKDSTESKPEFVSMSDEDIEKFIEKEFDDYYINEMGGDFGKNSSFKFLYNETCKTALNIVKFVRDELKQTSFRPVAVEYVLNKNGDEHILTISLSDGKQLVLSGTIDRVDTYTNEKGETFVRIIDYKTGKNIDLDYSRIYLGLNLQMFVYLSAVLSGKLKFTGENQLKQAGIAYFRLNEDSIDSISETKEEPEAEVKKNIMKAHKPLGIVVDDEELKNAYKNNDNYDYVPFKAPPKSTSKKKDDDKKSDNIKFENLVTDNKFTALREFAVEKVSEFGENLIQGKIPAQPVDMDKACKNCAYKNICANPYPDNAIDSTDSEYAKKLLEKIENKETEENNNEC